MLAGRNAKSRRELEAELAARAQGKRSLHLVVAGHVDAGKSTTMGRLLFELGDVSDKVMKKVRRRRTLPPASFTVGPLTRATGNDARRLPQFERDSQRLGKSSFAFAWVLDETDEERSRYGMVVHGIRRPAASRANGWRAGRGTVPPRFDSAVV